MPARGGVAAIAAGFAMAAAMVSVPSPFVAAAGPATRAEVSLDATRPTRKLSPLLFGMHIEWVENGLGLMSATSDGLRPEVVALLEPLRIPLLRFPGGILADYYDWRRGVGPASGRGTNPNPFTGQEEKSRFGTPELIALARALRAQALITANVGTGDAARAGAWAKQFADLGFAPQYWEVGNETYLTGPNANGPNGRAIHQPPERYAAAFAGYRDAIRKEIPSARVGAIAHLDTGAFPLAPEESRGWTTAMLPALRGGVDFFALHNAYAPVIIDDSVDFADPAERAAAYRSLYAAAEATRANLDEVDRTIDRLSPANRAAPFAITEFGPFFGVSQDPARHVAYVDQSRTLAAALYVASILDTFIADPRVFLACYTNPIHRWFGSLLTDTPQGLVRTPTYWIYDLYRRRFEPNLVATEVVISPSFSAAETGLVKAATEVPDVLAKASLSDDGKRLAVVLVNRSLDGAHDTTIEIKGFTPKSADCQVVTARSPAAINGSALGDTVQSGEEIRPKPLPCEVGPPIRFQLPASSFASVVAGAG
jgi:alpha-N-arabinofuranosidase